MSSLAALSDIEVLEKIKTLVAREQGLLARILAYLVAVEDRKIHLQDGCSSLFDFCLRRLKMSEGEAFRRIAVARLTRRFPDILGRIESGKIHLSALVLLRDVLNEDNYEDLVTKAEGKTKKAVQQLIAGRFSKPDVPSQIRKLPSAPATSRTVGADTPVTQAFAFTDPQPSPSPASSTSSTSTTPSSSMATSTTTAVGAHDASTTSSSTAPRSSPLKQASARANARIEPLSASRHKVQFTANDDLRHKLERATELMRHRNPSGDLGIVVERAVDLLLEKLEKEVLGKTARPQKKPRAAQPTHVTRAVRRAVFERDKGQCTFVSKTSGERCPSRAFIEVDHIDPRALGGASGVENTRLLCAMHNRLVAEEIFGRERIAEQMRLRRERSPGGVGAESFDDVTLVNASLDAMPTHSTDTT